MIVAALKEIGKENVTSEYISIIIKKSLKSESKEILLSDAYIAPLWITEILLNLNN